jgi:hypothetical protein
MTVQVRHGEHVSKFEGENVTWRIGGTSVGEIAGILTINQGSQPVAVFRVWDSVRRLEDEKPKFDKTQSNFQVRDGIDVDKIIDEFKSVYEVGKVFFGNNARR